MSLNPPPFLKLTDNLDQIQTTPQNLLHHFHMEVAVFTPEIHEHACCVLTQHKVDEYIVVYFKTATARNKKRPHISLWMYWFFRRCSKCASLKGNTLENQKLPH